MVAALKPSAAGTGARARGRSGPAAISPLTPAAAAACARALGRLGRWRSALFAQLVPALRHASAAGPEALTLDAAAAALAAYVRAAVAAAEAGAPEPEQRALSSALTEMCQSALGAAPIVLAAAPRPVAAMLAALERAPAGIVPPLAMGQLASHLAAAAALAAAAGDPCAPALELRARALATRLDSHALLAPPSSASHSPGSASLD